MSRIRWFSVPNPEHKRFPEWRRSFGIDDQGEVYVPAAMAGDENELNVMLCAADDRQITAVHLEHHFVPSEWLKREFPKHFELIEIIEARAGLTVSDGLVI
ncbi:hypothetical protein DY954_07590 [Pseudomonas aeruginosa]|uniref:hypothetical protein n=1 Tax=Pseudomonas aeruginosa TaxID=287 RepID=UPI000F84CBD0|nr:hypothetical protein [Pseudomonas aeruginosa]RTT13490.1 hypothetical protein DY954_07590 [Pseudomonas aeruginosa]